MGQPNADASSTGTDVLRILGVVPTPEMAHGGVMARFWGLLALWLLCAAGAVGVGFTASGLIEYPRSAHVGAHPAALQVDPRARLQPPPDNLPAGDAVPAASDPSPSATAATRGFTTEGGYVSGTCRAGRVSLSAAPHEGWTVTDLVEPGEESAEVGFIPAGQRAVAVAVEAWCLGGIPAFALDDVEADDGAEDEGPDDEPVTPSEG
jgi:hypothetical protein